MRRRLRAALYLALYLALASACVAGGTAATADDRVPPREHYLLNCSGCHGPDGAGVPGRVPELREMGRLFAAPGGREYLARVPGVAQAPMDDAALAALLNWLLVEFGDVAPAPPYEAAEVGRLRGAPLRDPLSARPDLAARPHEAR